MANITEEKWIEMLEKKADGTYIVKYPKVKSKSGVTFDEHLAENVHQQEVHGLKIDYGTWTPSLLFDGSSTGMSYDIREGHYFEIGNLVYFRFNIKLASKGTATGNASVEGFPFFSAYDENFPISLMEYVEASEDGLFVIPSVQMESGYSSMYIMVQANGQKSWPRNETCFKDNSHIKCSGWITKFPL